MGKESLQLCSQPSTYVVAKLRESERVAAQAQANCVQLERNLTQTQSALQASRDELEEMRTRMTVLLTQRGEVKRLTTLLELWRDQQIETGACQQELDHDSTCSDALYQDDESQGHGEKVAGGSLRTVADALEQVTKPTVRPVDSHLHSNEGVVNAPRTSSVSGANRSSPPSPAPATPISASAKPRAGSSVSPIDAQRALLASLSPEQLERMTARPSAHISPPQLVASAPQSPHDLEKSPASGKGWHSRSAIP